MAGGAASAAGWAAVTRVYLWRPSGARGRTRPRRRDRSARWSPRVGPPSASGAPSASDNRPGQGGQARGWSGQGGQARGWSGQGGEAGLVTAGLVTSQAG